MAKKYSANQIVQTNKFGPIKLLYLSSNSKWLVKFINTGTECLVSGGDITRGSVRDYNYKSVCGVACFGYGEFKAKINGRDTDCYKCWNHMISRCYKESDKSYSRYGGKGVSVCAEWLNFQQFAEWYYSNYPNDGIKYQLDKDIKIDGNKLYSPRLCLFVTAKENIIKANAKHYNLTSPAGINHAIYNMSEFCRENNLTMSAATLVSRGLRRAHKGWTAGS